MLRIYVARVWRSARAFAPSLQKMAFLAMPMALLLPIPPSLSFTGAALGAQRLTYDPASCKSNARGRLYIALGRNVLALPTTTPVAIQAELYGDRQIPPPDPSEPQGCGNNPLQLSGYAFPYADPATLSGKKKTSPNQIIGAQLIQLIKTVQNDVVPTDHDPIWPGEDLELGLASRICDHATIREHLPNGLRACRVKPDMDVEKRDWGASYIARPESYRTPMGRPFVINCGPLLLNGGPSSCNVAYVVRPGLGLAYRFEPYVGRRIIPIEHIIDFDRGLRAAIEAITVKDYRWPSPKAIPE